MHAKLQLGQRTGPEDLNTSTSVVLQDIENVLWGAADHTLVGAYNECSNGRTSLDAANSHVTDFVVLPCNGVS